MSQYFVCHDIQFSFENLFLNLDEKIVKCFNREDLFYCVKSRICLSYVNVCDGKKDCFFNEDEENCTNTELTFFFNCHSHRQQRISFKKICDYHNDCYDGSDEKYCSTLILIF